MLNKINTDFLDKEYIIKELIEKTISISVKQGKVIVISKSSSKKSSK